jgi:hypothetical protein
MRNIYIVTVHTGTAISRIIKNFSSIPYSHVSISLNKELKPMYSFGRIFSRTPIIAGLVQENINTGLYAIKKDTVCRVYEIEVEDWQYKLIESTLNSMWAERWKYRYDTRGLVRLAANRPRVRENKYVCSNFVAHILEQSNVNLIDKPFYTVQPVDFLLNIDDSKIVYEGLLSNYGCKFTNFKKLNL